MLIDSQAVIMCGISGSGKTRYAKSLAAHGYERVSADEIVWKEYGGPQFASLPQERRAQAYIEANAAIVAHVERILSAGGRVVVDATMCKRSRRDHLVGVCRARGVEPLIVYLNAPICVLASRLAERQGSGPDDQIVTDDELQRFYGNFEPPQPDEHFITVEQR